jgi:hypothetical protein
MSTTIWAKIRRSMRSGRLLKGKTYRVIETTETKIVAERIATGSLVSATRSMIEKTADRLQSGELIPFRSISYTVAIETLVVSSLQSIGAIEIDSIKKTYSRS